MLSGQSHESQTQTWWCLSSYHVRQNLSHHMPQAMLVCIFLYNAFTVCVSCLSVNVCLLLCFCMYASTWVTPGSLRCCFVLVVQIRWFLDSAGLSGPPGCSPDSARLGTDTGTAPMWDKTLLWGCTCHILISKHTLSLITWNFLNLRPNYWPHCYCKVHIVVKE